MDQVIIMVFRQMIETHGCSADDVLTDPGLRTIYLSSVCQHLMQDLPEQTLLQRLINLRKRQQLPTLRSLKQHDTTIVDGAK